MADIGQHARTAAAGDLVDLAIQLAYEQQIIPERYSVEELFAESRAVLGDL